MTGVVKKLILGLVVAYVGQLVLENWGGIPVVSWFALTPGGAGLWQLVTYVLVDLSHPLMFLLGLLFIWWALSPIETGFGPVRTLQLVAVSIVAGSLPAYLVGFVVRGSPPLFGSQTIWLGAFAAMTWLYRDGQVSLFGVMPMTARQSLLLLVGLTVLMFLASKDHTQLVASLGAMGGGIAFIRWMRRPRTPARVRRKPERSFRVIEGGGGGDDERPKWLN
jgi:membrane associated rhomboid family serine protease